MDPIRHQLSSTQLRTLAELRQAVKTADMFLQFYMKGIVEGLAVPDGQAMDWKLDGNMLVGAVVDPEVASAR